MYHICHLHKDESPDSENVPLFCRYLAVQGFVDEVKQIFVLNAIEFPLTNDGHFQYSSSLGKLGVGGFTEQNGGG